MNVHTAIKAASPTPLYSSFEKITPELAEAYLMQNTSNRNMRAIHVDRLASDILSGRWQMNGSTIVFSENGTLLDGQHRLAAVVKAGVPIDIMVIRGVAASAMKTIDSVVPRRVGDIAQLSGYSYSNVITSAARTLLSLKYGVIDSRRYITNSSILEFLGRHPQLQESAGALDPSKDIIPRSIGVSWYYLAKYKSGSPEKADEALAVIASGVPAYEGDPIHAFRERIIRMAPPEKNQSNMRLVLLSTLVAMWNDFVAGRQLTMCKLRTGAYVKMVGVDYSDL